MVAQTHAPGTSDAATTIMTCDLDGRVLTQTDAAWTVTRITYNDGGERASVTDALGQHAEVHLRQPWPSQGHDQRRCHGQSLGSVCGNGAQSTLSDAAGRLTGTGTNAGAATITGRGYALEAAGDGEAVGQGVRAAVSLASGRPRVNAQGLLPRSRLDPEEVADEEIHAAAVAVG